jgi:hypothetical protein
MHTYIFPYGWKYETKNVCLGILLKLIMELIEPSADAKHENQLPFIHFQLSKNSTTASGHHYKRNLPKTL